MRYIPLLLLCVSFCFAGINNYSHNFFQNSSASWHRAANESKAYLNYDKLIITDKTIKIIDEEFGEIPINKLCVDSYGLYTEIEDIDTHLATVWNIAWCKVCQDYRVVNINGCCTVCGTKF